METNFDILEVFFRRFFECVFASLELLDALPCGHVVHARCLQGNTACRQCGAGAAPAPAAGANPLDFLATVITAAKPSSSSK